MAVWGMRGRTLNQVGRSAYTLVVSALALIAIFGLTGSLPSGDTVYAPMALALAVGLLLTVRLAPYQAGGALVLLPAMAVDARFGLAALPMVGYVAIVINLVRGMRTQRVVSTAAHLVLAYAAADLVGHQVDLVPAWV